MKLVLSCEHGGNLIPLDWKEHFAGIDSVLSSHRGFDPGTEDMFDFLLPLANFGIKNKLSRLLIEFNRSSHHPQLFSTWSKNISSDEKEQIIKKYYQPYRDQLISEITNMLSKSKDPVLHISLHSFTPELNGKYRNNDLGLLYDPKRKLEKEFAQQFKKTIRSFSESYSVRYNYPYLGIADGLTTYLRKLFPENYLGIELEINQKWVEHKSFSKDLKVLIYRTISELINVELLSQAKINL
jgi:predicted N-formylglutamate amidohydrolase